MDEIDILRSELEHYRAEKERIREVVGQIGGKLHRRRDRAINLAFLALVLGAFSLDVLRFALDWEMPHLPPLLLVEIAVLLVSLKIIWMIHRQGKVDHFQFWILNSIEFQMNTLSRRLTDLAESIKATPGAPDPGEAREARGEEEPNP